jgi:hypothetical protein
MSVDRRTGFTGEQLDRDGADDSEDADEAIYSDKGQHHRSPPV